MKIKSAHYITISQTTIDTGLWHIRRELMTRYGTAQAERDIAPLQWYINTGRAPLDFIGELISAKPFMIARKLHMGGSHEEVIDRICKYIGFERS